MAKKKGKGGGARHPHGGRPQPARQQPRPKQARPPVADPQAATVPDGAPAAPSGATGTKARKLTQAERIEAARRERRRRSLRIRVAVVGAVVLLVVVGLAAIVSNRRAADSRAQQLEASGACSFDRQHDRLQPPPNNHVAPPGYRVNPPAGGDHAPAPSPAGDFSTGQTPGDPNVVHSLEHGYIALWYKPDIGERSLGQLREVFRAYSRDVLLLPRPSLPVPVAATAWERRILCERVDTEALRDFIRFYRNQGPEKVPH